MALTLGMTGMDPATETALRAAFDQANARMGRAWRLLSDQEADYVVVDMDSMYGPMSWLRLHAAGKRVIGLTSAPRSQTDYHLARPTDASAVRALLAEIAAQAGEDDTVQPAPEPAEQAAPAQPSGMSPSPVPQDQLPEELPPPRDEEESIPAGVRLPDSVEVGTLAPTTIEPAPMPAPPAQRNLFDWLVPGAVDGRRRFRDLLIDFDKRAYHGPAALKPLAAHFEGAVEREDFVAVDDATWAREAAALGAEQPLQRLQWFGGLVMGHGALLPGYDPDGRYRLTKWPQTEREFPKHFRIATTMMKGPATLEEIAAGSGVTRDEVVDFVNANLATGYAELVPETPPEPSEPARSAGLFGRLRGR
ncbi:MAG TPA: hypothetical protein VM576_01070 [Xanthomonadaceae bacterium]|jgi:hypothetical protein|nr:hypothetical protein [Xanthomonadaceae bacterium]